MTKSVAVITPLPLPGGTGLSKNGTRREIIKMHLCGTENGEIFVMSFLQPRQTRKISYREQQELLRIALEEHPEFNKQGMILDTIEKGGKEINSNALPREIL